MAPAAATAETVIFRLVNSIGHYLTVYLLCTLKMHRVGVALPSAPPSPSGVLENLNEIGVLSDLRVFNRPDPV